jgi:acetyltransferase-like isoleucine patch superfamily enzyme
MTMNPTGNAMRQAPNRRLPSEDPLQLFPRGLTKLRSLWMSWTYPFTSDVHELSVHYSCEMPRSIAPRIKLGNSIQIRRDTIIEVIAPPEQEGEPHIVIEDGSCVGPRCWVSARNQIHIERDVIIAQFVRILDHGPTYRNGTLPIVKPGVTGGRIRIGEGSWIGQGAAIVCTHGELVLGRNCVVATNAVITESFPSHSVIFGNPGRVVRQFDPAKKKWVLGAVQLMEPGVKTIGPPK